MNEIKREEFKKWLEKLNFRSIDFYISHIRTGLRILNEILEFQNMTDENKIIEFSKKIMIIK